MKTGEPIFRAPTGLAAPAIPALAGGAQDLASRKIRDACWHGEVLYRKIGDPTPMVITLHDTGFEDVEVCVYDNLCPWTISKGRL